MYREKEAVFVKKITIFILTIVLCSFSTHIQSEQPPPVSSPQLGSAAAASSSNAAALSMVTWGVAMAVAIGLICAFVKNSEGTSAHSH